MNAMQSIRALFFMGLILCVSMLYAETGQLQLITNNFEHPQLKTWATENANRLGGLQKGVDFMRLNEGDKLRLVQSADSLSQAHGFLSFDYRIYGLTASYTMETAQKLLPKIKMEIQNKFNLGSNLPYVLMISWLQHHSNQPDMILFVQWDGFIRDLEYDLGERETIQSYSFSKFEDAIITDKSTLNLGLSSFLQQFKLLLDPYDEGYFIVDGKIISSKDTIQLCVCHNKSIEILAFQRDGSPFSNKSKWKNAKLLSENRARIDIGQSTSSKGEFVEVSSVSLNGIKQLAVALVLILDIDYAEGRSKFEFDDNAIEVYKPQYDSINMNGKRRRFKLIPAGQSDMVAISANFKEPKAVHTNVGRASFSSGSDAMNIITAGKNTQNGVLHLRYKFCEKLPLQMIVPEQRTVDIRLILVNEEDDDVSIHRRNTGKPNMVAIRSKTMTDLTTNPQGDDSLDLVNKTILTGKDGICQTKAKPGDEQVIDFQNGGDSTWVCIGYGKNKQRDSKLRDDDKANNSSMEILAGKNGKCDTRPDSTTENYTISQATEGSILNGLAHANTVFGRFGFNLNVLQPVYHISVNYDRNYNDTLDRTEVGLLNYNVPQNLKGGNTFYIVKNTYSRSKEEGSSERAYSVAVGFSDIRSNVVCGKCMESLAQNAKDNPNDDKSFINYNWTLAHEFGHSELKLLHPWDDFIGKYNNTFLKETGQDSSNLMDYQGGFKLRYYQWLKFINN